MGTQRAAQRYLTRLYYGHVETEFAGDGGYFEADEPAAHED
nr:hypothetical protein [Nocardia jiangxiensis]